MSIKPSASAEIRSLLDALSGADPMKREAAIARLAVIGSRAVDQLLALYAAAGTTDATRLAILRTLEAIADPRGLAVLRDGLNASGELPAAAIGALRPLLKAESATAAAEALDALITVVLDTERDRALRLAAYDALSDVPADVRRRIAPALEHDPDAVVRARGAEAGGADGSLETEWKEALAGRLTDDPVRLAEAATIHADRAPLIDLQRLIDAVRHHETMGGRDGEWRELRGIIHAAIARRGSSVALYDLRETLERSPVSLPRTYVEALTEIGDETCLEPLASAYARSRDTEWRTALAGAFETIATRERTSTRSAVMKRIRSRWPEAAEALSMLLRTRPRPATARRT